MSVESGGRYIIYNEKSGTVLDLNGGDQTGVSGFSKNGGENQQWIVEQHEQGWTFRTPNGRYLVIQGDPNRAGNGTQVQGADFPWYWDIWPDQHDNAAHRIFVHGHPTALNLDLADFGNPNPNTPVQLWDQTPGRNQCWIFERVG